MLFVSRPQERGCSGIERLVSISESRRFSFRSLVSRYQDYNFRICFNLGIEMLFVSRCTISWAMYSLSANTSLSFNLGIEMLFVSSSYCQHLIPLCFEVSCFNLGIEMLFVSRDAHSAQLAFCFNLGIEMLFVSRCHASRHIWLLSVSISESRCFSFQVNCGNTVRQPHGSMFQSRNRDAFRFK